MELTVSKMRMVSLFVTDIVLKEKIQAKVNIM